jgi:glycosyltransferase involved in cell wall biosynthesis
MGIVIFGDAFSFPDGDAPTNRVHAYAKGFYENGVNVHVICFFNEYMLAGDGIVNGINFYHPLKQKKKSEHFIPRNWYKLLKYFNTIILLRRIAKKDKIEAIIVYTMLLNTHLFAWFLSRLVRSVLLVECGEYPLRNFQNGILKRKQGLLKLRIESKSCDGILCISRFLVDFYSKHGIPGNKLFIVPSTVDKERFRLSIDAPLTFEYILYCGGLTFLKDGVHILIESFAQISKKHQETNLVLIGKGDTVQDELSLKDLAKKFNITDRVFFLGFKSRSEIPAYLNNAKVLALARPRSLIAEAGFPSKLTEYLTTGVPVVVTEVGEIPVYLKNNENAFLSEPDSADAFAKRLDFVLDNYEFATEVAKKGKELTESIFSYKYQAKRVIEFINSI